MEEQSDKRKESKNKKLISIASCSDLLQTDKQNPKQRVGDNDDNDDDVYIFVIPIKSYL